MYFGAGDTEVVVEDALVVAGIDAFAEVLDVKVDVAVGVLAGTDDDVSVLGGVADGVTEQVGDNPSDLLAVDE